MTRFRRHPDAVVVGAATAVLVVVLAVGLALLPSARHAFRAGTGQEGLEPDPVCSLLLPIDREPPAWIDPSGRLAISEQQAGQVALAFGLRASFDPEDHLASAVASLLGRRFDDRAIRLTPAEREALADLEVLKAAC
ncbi:MAG: hypothetical protein JWM47_2920 [Acidimicrobiales bacterium]|nr:hypothetical protein [Acidimicrobiales bacterium]